MKKTKEWANFFHNSEYCKFYPEKYRDELKKDNVVVVYGGSDDLLEMDGAFHDEFPAYDGALYYFDGKKYFFEKDEIDTCLELIQDESLAVYNLVKNIINKNNHQHYIKINTDVDGATFDYETNIPCEWFDIYDDENQEELYCKGFVFDLDSILDKEN